MTKKAEEPKPQTKEERERDFMLFYLRKHYGDPFRVDAKLRWPIGDPNLHAEVVADCNEWCIWIHGGMIKHYGYHYGSPFTNLQAGILFWETTPRSPDGSFDLQPGDVHGVGERGGMYQRAEAPPIQIQSGSDQFEPSPWQGEGGLQSHPESPK